MISMAFMNMQTANLEKLGRNSAPPTPGTGIVSRLARKIGRDLTDTCRTGGWRGSCLCLSGFWRNRPGRRSVQPGRHIFMSRENDPMVGTQRQPGCARHRDRGRQHDCDRAQ
jgi:hypothetical protein